MAYDTSTLLVVADRKTGADVKYGGVTSGLSIGAAYCSVELDSAS
jgi:hypothetical protein